MKKEIHCFLEVNAVHAVHHPVDNCVNQPNYECHEYGSHHDNDCAVDQFRFGWPGYLMNEFVIRFLDIRKYFVFFHLSILDN